MMHGVKLMACCEWKHWTAILHLQTNGQHVFTCFQDVPILTHLVMIIMVSGYTQHRPLVDTSTTSVCIMLLVVSLANQKHMGSRLLGDRAFSQPKVMVDHLNTTVPAYAYPFNGRYAMLGFDVWEIFGRRSVDFTLFNTARIWPLFSDPWNQIKLRATKPRIKKQFMNML